MTSCHLELKPGVRLHGLCPQMVLFTDAVKDLWGELGFSTLTITVGIEGQHTDAPYPSGHYRGMALDYRTKNLWGDPLTGEPTVLDREERLRNVVSTLRQRMGPDFFVKLEFYGQDEEHIHGEWRPASRY